jgi:hypothetical protein
MSHSHFDRDHCNCSHCRLKRHQRFDHKDFCTCGKEHLFSSRNQQHKCMHCNRRDCMCKKGRESFKQIPSLRKHAKNNQHSLDHFSIPHHMDRNGKNNIFIFM